MSIPRFPDASVSLGDVLDIMELRHDWAKMTFTPELFKYVFFNLIPEVIKHTESQDEEQVRDHYDRKCAIAPVFACSNSRRVYRRRRLLRMVRDASWSCDSYLTLSAPGSLAPAWSILPVLFAILPSKRVLNSCRTTR